MSKPITQDERRRLIDELSTWGFKPHRLSERDLYLVACLVFEAILRIEGVAELELKPGMFTPQDAGTPLSTGNG
jgi:hypothetical protein